MSEETENKTTESNEADQLDEMTAEELEKVDQLIDEVDPDFKKQAEKISEVGAEINPDDIEIEEYSDDISEEESDETDWLQKLLIKLQDKYPKMVPLFKKFEGWMKKWEIKKLRLRNQIYSYLLSSFHFLKNDFPGIAKSFAKRSKDLIVDAIKKLFAIFWGTKTRSALSLFLLVLIGVSSFMFYKLAFQKGWLPSVYQEEITSFADLDHHVHHFKPKNLLYLHEAFPEAEYSFKLKNIVVNLKSSDAASSPAFASIVFYLSLDSTDTAVEIKDRETEVLDATQRTVESFSFKQLSSIEGQKNMLKAVKKTINEVLNQGFVKDVYIKHKILKPASF